ncbi:CehA/McbA family metallohydrolase [Anatilimnocola floriformis]|uniref:CehA/McbA family metallohydrolase n=1 Tax=Anatilimnocola floriformis TaxID=2948575 RepID=UPI0020C41C1C|nr:CehA/McbA family metallohydrolase [Anatilimnocola floriformis]
MHRWLWIAAVFLLCNSASGEGLPHPKLTHLRNEPSREWTSFPEQAEGSRLEIQFDSKPNAKEHTLRIRQQDVKQAWRVLLNKKPLGELIRDEADIVWYLPIPAQALIEGQNTLLIEAKANAKPVADDIRVGELLIEPRPVKESLAEAACRIAVVDEATKQPIPARITIVNQDGALQATSAVSSATIAARPGVIYTADGHATFSVPAGKYTIYASRGFEYSVAKTEVNLAVGERHESSLQIRREVSTPGLVACDTHIHTFTHSGHGDATLDERLITLAGEGIELPIAADHNKHIDYRPDVERLKLGKYFTPVMGNEVTTQVGHFNLFPVEAGARVPNHQLKDWAELKNEIFDTPGVQVCILNHARDIHNNVRPFGPDLFNATIGENFHGWPMFPNAMEIINSGATQNEPLRLLHDWLATINRGYKITPVGSSDSHDVSRYIVGQGRTYIRCDDQDVGKLDAATAIKSFLAGRVAVSYGLLVEMKVDDKFQPGDLATGTNAQVKLQLRVLGPHWTTARKVQLYMNGELFREEKITPPADRAKNPGVQWEATWTTRRLKHDVHLVAVALGDEVTAPYWAMAKPYQPTSPEFAGMSLGVTGPIWIDGDGDGLRTTPRGYAEPLAKKAGADWEQLASSLKPFDNAVAAQAMHLYLQSHPLPDNFDRPNATVSAGMRAAWQAFREQELARARQ